MYVIINIISSFCVLVAPTSEGIAPAVTLTDNALKHLNKMRSERNEDLCLRIGVRQGGCSGMSYTMDFESRENARPDDSIIEYNGFVIGKPFLSYFLAYVMMYSLYNLSHNLYHSTGGYQ